MQNISLSADERRTVSQYMLKLSMAYRYNRKVTLLKWSCIIIKNELNTELIRKGFKYFKNYGSSCRKTSVATLAVRRSCWMRLSSFFKIQLV